MLNLREMQLRLLYYKYIKLKSMQKMFRGL